MTTTAASGKNRVELLGAATRKTRRAFKIVFIQKDCRTKKYGSL